MTEIFQDIRAHYRFWPPAEELAPFVEFFSVSAPQPGIESVNGISTVKMFASFTPTFYLNLGPAYGIDLNGRYRQIAAGEDILILRNDTVTRFINPLDNIFTVKFHPGGLEAVLGINQAAFKDSVTDLATLLPERLLNAMKSPASIEDRVKLMQDFLLTALLKRSRSHYLQMVSSAISTYQHAGLRFNAAQLAKELFLSSKTMNRYFFKVVGAPPKHYLSIVRARIALTEYISHGEHFTAEDFGYYDANHFRKDIMRFTGQKLSEKRL